MSKCVALGHSRESPVATFFGQIERTNEYREVAWHILKRLPSGRWNKRVLSKCQPFEDENENKASWDPTTLLSFFLNAR